MMQTTAVPGRAAVLVEEDAPTRPLRPPYDAPARRERPVSVTVRREAAEAYLSQLLARSRPERWRGGPLPQQLARLLRLEPSPEVLYSVAALLRTLLEDETGPDPAAPGPAPE